MEEIDGLFEDWRKALAGVQSGRPETVLRLFIGNPFWTAGGIAIQSDLRDAVSRVLESMTSREERILRMRFGIGTKSDHTLEQVGQVFSVTRERIRQIEAKALRKLKHPSRARALRSFLEK